MWCGCAVYGGVGVGVLAVLLVCCLRAAEAESGPVLTHPAFRTSEFALRDLAVGIWPPALDRHTGGVRDGGLC